MHALPDGSGFFTAIVGGLRDPGIVPWLKYRSNNTARGWFLAWRNYRSAIVISRLPEHGSPMSHWRALRCSLLVKPPGWF